LDVCAGCGGDTSNAERFTFESDRAMRAVDPKQPLPPGGYSIIKRGCRWCSGTGVMTKEQRKRYADFLKRKKARRS